MALAVSRKLRSCQARAPFALASAPSKLVLRQHQTQPAVAHALRATQGDQPALWDRRSVLTLGTTALVISTLPMYQLLTATAAQAGPVTPSPEVSAAINAALDKAIGKAKAPVTLRLVFHDAGTFSAVTKDGGQNGSIRFELDRPENFGLKRGWRLIEEVQRNLKGTPAQGKVSYADLIALAGAYAVAVCGGPKIQVPIGRVDATEPSGDPINRLPAENLSAADLKANFAAKGLSVQEFVALSGAHTLGSKGFGDPVKFDNIYYSALLQKPWLNPNDSMASMIGLPSDHVLPDDPDCRPVIEAYAQDQGKFFDDFSNAYIKLTMLGVQWA